LRPPAARRTTTSQARTDPASSYKSAAAPPPPHVAPAQADGRAGPAVHGEAGPDSEAPSPRGVTRLAGGGKRPPRKATPTRRRRASCLQPSVCTTRGSRREGG